MENLVGKKLPIYEVVPVIQGEGKLVGVPHILIRFLGCKLRCMFKDSICDSYYTSWRPEKDLEIGLRYIENVYTEHRNITHTMITGGGPTMHPKVLQELCTWIKGNFGHYITIETEGSNFVQTAADFISLSPKLSNSTPIKGKFISELNREVDDLEIETHERWRKNYTSMRNLLSYHSDYQLKFVISDLKDLIEIEEVCRLLDVSKNSCWLMPEGATREDLDKRRKWVYELCLKEGYNYSDRLHIIVYDNLRGV